MPVLAALGGMILPAVIFLAVNGGGDGVRGWGMAMATDIAFVLGALALLGPRCPDQLRLFLLTVAIVDDIGAILVIAVFYSDDLSLPALLAWPCWWPRWWRCAGCGSGGARRTWRWAWRCGWRC